ncbi:MAG: DHH family phosphoesterase [Anaerolineae bacterium]|nr:DHH family phosphoesterase [Anaerolineae bacterium]
MASNSDTILVIGHRNPDMDAIASAMGYTYLLNTTGTGAYTAGRTGEVNAQTRFALEKFGMQPPPLVADVWAHVGDLAEAVPSLRKGQTLLEACQLIARTRRPAPILDNASPVGLLTGASLFSKFVEALSSDSLLKLATELSRPVESAVDPAGTVLLAGERVRDVVGQALRSDQDEFLVLDENGKYVGLCRKSALLAPVRRKLVMVDHNELTQAVSGLEEAELVEVLDHHRLGNVPTSVPIRFHVDPVGSCSTLVTERALDMSKSFPASLAGILLCGILSDTLVFRSPTTTPRDRAVATQLGQMAGLDGEAGIEELGQALLAAGAGLGMRTGSEIINTDLKYYDQGGIKAGIAQVEVASFGEISPRLDDLKSALGSLAASQKLGLALLMVTDVVRGNSRLVVEGQPRIISALPYARLDDETLDAPGVVSRKKQLLPAVLAAISEVV